MRTGVVTLEPVFGRLTGNLGAADRLPGARGIRRAEIHPARLVQPAEIRRISRQAAARTTSEILLVDRKGTVLVAPAGQGLDRAGRRIDRELGPVPLCGRAEPRALPEMTDRDGRTHVWAVARSPSIRDAGLYIMVGLSKDGLVAAANRRLYEDMAMLAVASLLLLAGVWLLATLSVGRQVGRLAAMATKLGLGDLSARIAAAPSARRTGRADDAAQRHRRVARAPARRDRRAQSETQPIPENGGDGSTHRRRGARFQQSADRHPRQCGIPRREAGGKQGTAPDRREHRDRRRARLRPDAGACSPSRASSP